MKTVCYSPAAQRSLKRHFNVAPRLRQAITEYAANPAANANNLTQMVGSMAKRMRVGDSRIIFEETETDILVTKLEPPGSIY